MIDVTRRGFGALVGAVLFGGAVANESLETMPTRSPNGSEGLRKVHGVNLSRCTVCGEAGFVAEDADVVEERRGLVRPMTCCFNTTDSELYIHEDQ